MLLKAMPFVILALFVWILIVPMLRKEHVNGGRKAKFGLANFSGFRALIDTVNSYKPLQCPVTFTSILRSQPYSKLECCHRHIHILKDLLYLHYLLCWCKRGLL